MKLLDFIADEIFENLELSLKKNGLRNIDLNRHYLSSSFNKLGSNYRNQFYLNFNKIFDEIQLDISTENFISLNSKQIIRAFDIDQWKYIEDNKLLNDHYLLLYNLLNEDRISLRIDYSGLRFDIIKAIVNKLLEFDVKILYFDYKSIEIGISNREFNLEETDGYFGTRFTIDISLIISKILEEWENTPFIELNSNQIRNLLSDEEIKKKHVEVSFLREKYFDVINEQNFFVKIDKADTFYEILRTNKNIQNLIFSNKKQFSDWDWINLSFARGLFEEEYFTRHGDEETEIVNHEKNFFRKSHLLNEKLNLIKSTEKELFERNINPIFNNIFTDLFNFKKQRNINLKMIDEKLSYYFGDYFAKRKASENYIFGRNFQNEFGACYHWDRYIDYRKNPEDLEIFDKKIDIPLFNFPKKVQLEMICFLREYIEYLREYEEELDWANSELNLVYNEEKRKKEREKQKREMIEKETKKDNMRIQQEKEKLVREFESDCNVIESEFQMLKNNFRSEAINTFNKNWNEVLKKWKKKDLILLNIPLESLKSLNYSKNLIELRNQHTKLKKEVYRIWNSLAYQNRRRIEFKASPEIVYSNLASRFDEFLFLNTSVLNINSNDKIFTVELVYGPSFRYSIKIIKKNQKIIFQYEPFNNNIKYYNEIGEIHIEIKELNSICLIECFPVFLKHQIIEQLLPMNNLKIIEDQLNYLQSSSSIYGLFLITISELRKRRKWI